MKNLVNLTPHKIDILFGVCDVCGARYEHDWIGYRCTLCSEAYNDIQLGSISIEPSGNVIRLSEKVEKIGEINGIPITKKQYGSSGYVPEEKEGTFYIVSGLVASAMKRPDLLVPNTVRDDDGKIIGCDSLSVITD